MYVNLEDIPDEGYQEVRSIIAKLENPFKNKENECLREYEDILKENSTLPLFSNNMKTIVTRVTQKL